MNVYIKKSPDGERVPQVKKCFLRISPVTPNFQQCSHNRPQCSLYTSTGIHTLFIREKDPHTQINRCLAAERLNRFTLTITKQSQKLWFPTKINKRLAALQLDEIPLSYSQSNL